MENRKVPVTNRANQIVFYDIPELNVKREFAADETKYITIDELKQLQYIPGGATLIQNYLLIKDEEALNELQLSVGELYNLNRDDIKTILFNGSKEDLLYFVTHAPKAELEIMKEVGVQNRFSDIEKNELIKEKTTIDIMGTIRLNDQIDIYDKTNNIKKDEPVNDETPAGILNILKNKKTTTSTTTKNKITDTEEFEVIE